MEKDKAALITSIIAIMLSLGMPMTGLTIGSVLDNELKDHYICSIDDNIVEFKGGISGTKYTGYPFEDSRKGAKRCGTTDNKGIWIKLSEYAEEVGIDPYDLLIQEEENKQQRIRKDVYEYNCYSSGCET